MNRTAMLVTVFGLSLAGLIPGFVLGGRLVYQHLVAWLWPSRAEITTIAMDAQDGDAGDGAEEERLLRVPDVCRTPQWSRPDAAWALVFLLGAVAMLIGLWKMVPSIESTFENRIVLRGSKAEVMERFEHMRGTLKPNEALGVFCPGQGLIVSYEPQHGAVEIDVVADSGEYDAILHTMESSLPGTVQRQFERAQHPGVRFYRYDFTGVSADAAAEWVLAFLNRADTGESKELHLSVRGTYPVL